MQLPFFRSSLSFIGHGYRISENSLKRLQHQVLPRQTSQKGSQLQRDGISPKKNRIQMVFACQKKKSRCLKALMDAYILDPLYWVFSSLSLYCFTGNDFSLGGPNRLEKNQLDQLLNVISGIQNWISSQSILRIYQ